MDMKGLAQRGRMVLGVIESNGFKNIKLNINFYLN